MLTSHWLKPEPAVDNAKTIRDEKGRLDLTRPFPLSEYVGRVLVGRTITEATMRVGGSLYLMLDNGETYVLEAHAPPPQQGVLRMNPIGTGRLP